MKFFAAIALIAIVASATAIKRSAVTAELAEIQEIIAAINSPSTDPATAAALEQMLQDVLGLNPEPISVGPAIVDFPLPEGGGIAGAIVLPDPSPAVVAPAPSPAVPASSAPLVQLIVNVNQAASESTPIVPNPVAVAPEEIQPTPVQVVEVAPEPIQVVEVAPEPVQVVEVAPEPVQVIEAAPVPVEPVVIGTPVIPSPAVVLPEDLN